MLTIRDEISADIPHIYRVNRDAFGQHAEADLVDALRANGNALFSLVATLDEQLVGHIMVSPVTIVDDNAQWSAVAIGPVAVATAFQRRGVGSKLVRAALDRCRQHNHTLVFLLGHPSYYPRFGFVPAQPRGIRLPYNVSVDAFMVAELEENALNGRRGVLYYSPEFDGV